MGKITLTVPEGDGCGGCKFCTDGVCRIFQTPAVKKSRQCIEAGGYVPVKHGRWIAYSNSDECSVCGYETKENEIGGRKCPKCGALMIW